MDFAVTKALAKRIETMPGRPAVIQHENLLSRPPPELYLRATLLPVDQQAEAIFGADGESGPEQVLERFDAEYQVDVFADAAMAEPQGSGPAKVMVDQIKAWFRPGLRMVEDDITVRVERSRSFPAVPGVPRYQIPVRVRVYAHTTPSNGG